MLREQAIVITVLLLAFFLTAEGHFEVKEVPVGPQTVLVSVVGFGLVRRDLIVDAANPVEITIPVAERASTCVEDVAVCINTQTRRVFEPLDALFPLLPVAGILIEF